MSGSHSARPLAAARPIRGVHLVASDPVPVGEELERFMTELGRLVADLWFERKFDARSAPEDVSKSDD